MDDVIYNKAATIERCIQRVRVTYLGKESFRKDINQQDVIILNIQRAVQACIDLATHYVRIKKWGVPQSYGENFDILKEQNLISSELADRLIAMVGFRNIAIHDYQQLKLDIIISIINDHLDDMMFFSSTLVKSDVK